MYELKNNSDGGVHFRRPDLKLNFDLGPGESYVITDRQAMAVEMYLNDMDLELVASNAKEPDEESQNVEVDREAAVRGVANVAMIDFAAASVRPENRGDFYNAPKSVESMSSEEKQDEVVKAARVSKKAEAKLEKVKESLPDEEKAKAEENIKKEEKTAKEAAKHEPITGGVDVGELVPMAGKDPASVTKDPAEKSKDSAKK